MKKRGRTKRAFRSQVQFAERPKAHFHFFLIFYFSQISSRYCWSLPVADTHSHSTNMADATPPSSSDENGGSSSSSSRITSMAEDLQRTVLNSTDSALRSARSLHHTSQDFLSHLASNSKTYEHAFFNTLKGIINLSAFLLHSTFLPHKSYHASFYFLFYSEGLMTSAEHPAAAVGLGVAATFLLVRGYIFKSFLCNF